MKEMNNHHQMMILITSYASHPLVVLVEHVIELHLALPSLTQLLNRNRSTLDQSQTLAATLAVVMSTSTAAVAVSTEQELPHLKLQ